MDILEAIMLECTTVLQRPRTQWATWLIERLACFTCASGKIMHKTITMFAGALCFTSPGNLPIFDIVIQQLQPPHEHDFHLPATYLALWSCLKTEQCCLHIMVLSLIVFDASNYESISTFSQRIFSFSFSSPLAVWNSLSQIAAHVTRNL